MDIWLFFTEATTVTLPITLTIVHYYASDPDGNVFDSSNTDDNVSGFIIQEFDSDLNI